MYNKNCINISPKLINGVLRRIAEIVILIIVVMAFIRPWYNAWSQEMDGKAEFAKTEQDCDIFTYRDQSADS